MIVVRIGGKGGEYAKKKDKQRGSSSRLRQRISTESTQNRHGSVLNRSSSALRQQDSTESIKNRPGSMLKRSHCALRQRDSTKSTKN